MCVHIEAYPVGGLYGATTSDLAVGLRGGDSQIQVREGT
jgi:hypothetical protein